MDITFTGARNRWVQLLLTMSFITTTRIYCPVNGQYDQFKKVHFNLSVAGDGTLLYSGDGITEFEIEVIPEVAQTYWN